VRHPVPSGPARGGAAPLARAARWLVRTLVEPPLPLLAVELRARAVAVVRLAREGTRLALAAAAAVELREGILEPSLGKPNILDADALRAALGAALERAGALALVLPDPAVRLTLVPAAGLRGRRAEVEETVRFRLQKALPADFDVRSARLAWRAVSPDELLVAVARDEVVRSYEEAVAALGFHPGLVEPAGLALASLGGSPEDAAERLLVNWDHGYVSFQVRRGGRPLLLRTLPHEDAREAVARHAEQTLRFHREQLGGRGFDELVLRSAALDPAQASEALAGATGVVPRLVRPWAALGDDDDGAEAQAVAGAAASVLRRVA
jgi:hypothetical protein